MRGTTAERRTPKFISADGLNPYVHPQSLTLPLPQRRSSGWDYLWDGWPDSFLAFLAPSQDGGYVADPLCGFPASVQLWVDLLDGWAAVSTSAHRKHVPKTLPLYVIAGGRDPVSGSTRQLEPWLADYRAAGFMNVKHRFYPEARHELFNETNRDEVTAELIAWLNQV